MSMLLLLMLLCPCCPCCRLQVKEQMADPAFQDSIRDASLAACTQLPAGVMQDTCTAFVEQYGERSQEEQVVLGPLVPLGCPGRSHVNDTCLQDRFVSESKQAASLLC